MSGDLFWMLRFCDGLNGRGWSRPRLEERRENLLSNDIRVVGRFIFMITVVEPQIDGIDY